MDTLNKIKNFIFDQGFGYSWSFPFSFKKKQLTRKTSIEKDLNITGDDAEEFLIAFGKAFNVDVNHFPIGDYFADEGDKILPALIRAIAGKKQPQTKNLTIGDLEKAIAKGRLDEEVITI